MTCRRSSSGMNNKYRWERIRINRLRSSKCTHVQLEKTKRMVYESWCRVREARIHLERAKRNWYDDAPRPVDHGRPFCFVLRRMRRTWRQADRANDRAGFPVHRTVGSTETRRHWSAILGAVIANDEVIRIRHQHCDEPAILVSESRFRALERAAPDAMGHRDVAARSSGAASRPADARSGQAYLTRILGSG
jgi:hypothetical protein